MRLGPAELQGGSTGGIHPEGPSGSAPDKGPAAPDNGSVSSPSSGAPHPEAQTGAAAGLASLTGAEKRLLKTAGRLHSLSDCIWIAQAWLIAQVAAEFLSAAPTAPLLSNPLVWIQFAAVVLLAFVRMRLNLMAAARAGNAARAVKTRVRQRLLGAISKASPASPLPASGEVAAHVGDQVDALGPYLSRFFPQKIRLSLVPVAIVLATLWVSWLAALILLLTGPVIPVFMALIGLRAKAASEEQQGELTRMSGFLLDRVRGLETLRLFGAVERTRQDIIGVGERFRTGTMKVLRIAFLSSTVLELFSALGIAFVAVYVGFSLLGDISTGTWGDPLTYGPGLFILLLAPEFFTPLRAYAAAYHDRAAGLAATDKLSELYRRICAQAEGNLASLPLGDAAAATGAATGGAGHLPLCIKMGKAPAIVFHDVGLRLGGQPVLQGVSLAIGAGEKISLHGASGAGKTTMIDCLLGLHDLGEGHISVDGQDLRQIDLHLWRNAIAWVGQAPRLFHGSLKANLLRGNPQAGEEDMWRALHLAGAAELVERLPRGLGTLVGEDGFGLSVGEMRRIALARAAIRTSAVLILADEPTAGLDGETAADVICGLNTLAQGRTLIAATHDPRMRALEAREIQVADLMAGGKSGGKGTE